MTHQQFKDLTEKIISQIRIIADTKGKEYTNSETDRLANFKDIAAEIGVSPLQVLLTYSEKHGRAIKNYCKCGGKSHSNESIESRVLDRIVYDFLFLGLIEDSKPAGKNESSKNDLTCYVNRHHHWVIIGIDGKERACQQDYDELGNNMYCTYCGVHREEQSS